MCNLVSGRLRTQNKQIQFKKVCEILNLTYKDPEALTFNNSWLAGFFTGDGHFNLNRVTFQSTIGISQKEEFILQQIKNVFGGNVHYDKS